MTKNEQVKAQQRTSNCDKQSNEVCSVHKEMLRGFKYSWHPPNQSVTRTENVSAVPYQQLNKHEE